MIKLLYSVLFHSSVPYCPQRQTIYYVYCFYQIKMSPQNISEKNKEQQNLNEISAQQQQDLAKQLLNERVAVETKREGMISNFFGIVSQKTYEVFLSIIGDYHYKSKNEFSYNQKVKMLSYLQSKVLSANALLEDKQKIRFADYDVDFLKAIPEDFQQLRSKILKGRTNLQSAVQSLQRLKYSKEYLKAKYLNEQAYQFDRMKANSLGWGLVFGSLINATYYRGGNTVRKAALFVTVGYLFSAITHRFNIDRYFDSVYPIFREEAVQFTKQQRQQFKDWMPEGKAVVQE